MSRIRETLAKEAAEAEAQRDQPSARMYRARATSGDTNHVYSVRMPAERLAELRTVAEQLGEQPSALMRRWVLERLDDERTHQPDLVEVRRNLTSALDTLDQFNNKHSA